MTCLASASALLANGALAQDPSLGGLQDRIVGSWTSVSCEMRPQQDAEDPTRARPGSGPSGTSGVRPSSFIIDAFDREVIAHVAVTGAGISSSDVRELMLTAVEKRFDTDRAPHPVEHLSDNVVLRRWQDARLRPPVRPRSLLHACPVTGERRNGRGLRLASGSTVHWAVASSLLTLERDSVRVTPLPDAATVLGLVPAWIDDYNTAHPHSALAMSSPVEFGSALDPNQAVR